MAKQTLLTQFNYTFYVLNHNTKDISDEESLRAPSDGGNTLNWVLGHILSTRNAIVKLLGAEPFWSEAQVKLYDRGSKPVTDAAIAVPLSQMVLDLEASQARIAAGLEQVTAEQLVEPAAFSPMNRDDETVGTLLAGLLFHEAYHSGQTGTMRHILGKEERLT